MMDSSLQPFSKLMAPYLNPFKQTKFFQLFYEYMVSGVIDAKIEQDGGIQCYNEIPKIYHVSVIIIGTIIHTFILIKFWDCLKQKWTEKNINNIKNSTLQKLARMFDIFMALLGFFTLIVIFYIKLGTKKGLFILNPCHVSLFIQSYLLLVKKNEFNKAIHTCYISSVYGAVIALIFPHTNGILPIQFFFYYLQHFLITPIGVILLYRHYGYPQITFANHVVSFSSACIYQFIVLGPAAIMSMVNLNFILCHTPVDVGIDYYGYHYIVVGVPVLGIYSLISRFLFFLMFFIWKLFKRIIGIEQNKIKEN